MSRIGRKPIAIPDGVDISIADRVVKVKGPEGTLEQALPPRVEAAIDDGQLVLQRASEEKQDRAYHGLARALLANAVQGVSKKFEKALEIHGIGYRAQMEGDAVIFNVGYSHPVNYPVPRGIEIEVEKQTTVIVRGMDKQKVGQAAAEIRSLRKRDIYKGKGIRYKGELVRLKAGKAGA